MDKIADRPLFYSLIAVAVVLVVAFVFWAIRSKEKFVSLEALYKFLARAKSKGQNKFLVFEDGKYFPFLLIETSRRKGRGAGFGFSLTLKRLGTENHYAKIIFNRKNGKVTAKVEYPMNYDEGFTRQLRIENSEGVLIDGKLVGKYSKATIIFHLGTPEGSAQTLLNRAEKEVEGE